MQAILLNHVDFHVQGFPGLHIGWKGQLFRYLFQFSTATVDMRIDNDDSKKEWNLSWQCSPFTSATCVKRLVKDKLHLIFVVFSLFYFRQFLIPGFVDTHIHAPQYVFTGTGYDLPLLQWLEKYTFPSESRFGNTEFAKDVYRKVVVIYIIEYCELPSPWNQLLDV